MAWILVVDDDWSYRNMLRLILEGRGHVVIEAADGSEGLAGCGRIRVFSGFSILLREIMGSGRWYFCRLCRCQGHLGLFGQAHPVANSFGMRRML